MPSMIDHAYAYLDGRLCLVPVGWFNVVPAWGLHDADYVLSELDMMGIPAYIWDGSVEVLVYAYPANNINNNGMD